MGDGDGDNNVQNNTSGGNGYQYNGDSQNNYTGDGMTINNNMNAATHAFEDTRKKIIQSLYTSPYLQRKNRNPDRVTGTCEWFLNHPDFHHWRHNTSSSMLWVSANPGCGKSVLAKCLVDELKSTEVRTTCYFFFKDDFEDQRSARGALSCILHQLFVQKENLLSAGVMDRLKSYKAPLANSYHDLWELWDILLMASQARNAGEIICILDAFDECDNQDRQDLAKIVREFYVQSDNAAQSVNLKLLITSRPYDKIRRELIPFNPEDFPVIHLKGDGDMEAEKIAEEISLFIKDRVSHIRTNLDLTEKEEALLLQGLEAVPNQTYLWVYLTLDWIETEICNNISETKIRNAISILPRTVDEAYDKILAKSTDVIETKKLLHIIVAAERPLTIGEMDLALLLQPHHKHHSGLERRPSDRFRKYIRDLCGLFINIKDEKIYLLHQTAKEFLVSKGQQNNQEGVIPQRTDGSDGSEPDNRSQLTWRYSLIPSESHCILFKSCIWYLLFECFNNARHWEDVDECTYGQRFSFFEYSAKSWVTHFHASGIDGTEFRWQLHQLCYPRSGHCRTWFQMYWADMHPGVEFPWRLTTLIVASYLGVETIVRRQLQLPHVRLNVVDSSLKRSALSWASEYGYEGIVKLLIRGPEVNRKTFFKHFFRPFFFKGATVDITDSIQRTPLSYASSSGHLSVVRVLLKAGARANLEDKIGGTPISYALCTGHQEIANELTKGAKNPLVDKIRDDLLLSAAKNGHQPTVQRLLDSGADIEAVGVNGWTPLVIAIVEKHVSLAQFLIDRGAALNPEKGYYRCYFHEDGKRIDKDAGDGPVNARDLQWGHKSDNR